ncbi:amidohydrolase family protein [Acidimicrobiia bacterium EGI L10123]|uniref:amidohydrolase family protein n=1 Tax=Salinilacustrithrix flava TaxID=2957203 RepID=UPI003D7C2121|nr:amidohydrolase family protein [Acidimicrobiia bacterium EGI L10123]
MTGAAELHSRLCLREVEVDGAVVDVVIDDGVVTAIGPRGSGRSERAAIDGGGGALIPGLWDHHIHLLALAAMHDSTVVGPPTVTSREELSATLRKRAATTAPGDWIRAVGYHESIAGPLDRDQLDGIVDDHPVRVQHRSGARWILNSEAVRRVGLDRRALDGAELDETGRPTGRLHGADAWLREQLAPTSLPDLAGVGADLARRGVVGVTDMTPYESVAELEALAGAVVSGTMPQHVVATGGPPLTELAFPVPLRRGPVKLVIDERTFPDFDTLTTWIDRAHRAHRPVAVHCVSRSALALVVAAWAEVGARSGDRIEHGSVIPPELRDELARLPVTVVTQPGFVAERGDQYLRDVEGDDVPHLYPCASLLDAGIPVAASTDAPFGRSDPWLAVHAAVQRRTSGGVALGEREAVDARRALSLFLGEPDDPGGPGRVVRRGARADLCLLTDPLGVALASPADVRVRATLVSGRVVHGPTDG